MQSNHLITVSSVSGVCVSTPHVTHCEREYFEFLEQAIEYIAIYEGLQWELESRWEIAFEIARIMQLEKPIRKYTNPVFYASISTDKFMSLWSEIEKTLNQNAALPEIYYGESS